MADKEVILLEKDAEKVEFYQSYLAVYSVKTRKYSSLADFSAEDEQDFLFLLISYQVILGSERSNVISLFQKYQDHEIVVYDVPENANRRLAFYDLGARRVYDSSYSPQEVCHSLKWLIDVLSASDQKVESYSRGRLEDIPVQSLILLLGRENRTGVLKLISEYNSGKIYFFNGNIDAAQVGTHFGKAAVLHMILWRKGHFIFSPSDHLAQETHISLSNFGFVIMAQSIQREMEDNLRQIGPPESVLRVRYAGDLLQSGLDIDERFISHIKNPRILANVLENPVYTSFETAQKLILLKNKGYLSVNEASQRSLSSAIPRAEEEAATQLPLPGTQIEIDLIKESLHLPEEQKSMKLLLLYNPQQAESSFVRTFIPEMIREAHTQIKGITQLSLSAEFNVYLLAMETDQKSLDFILGMEKGDFHGYIFLLDAAAEYSFEYSNYLINQLLTNRPAPAVVAVGGLAGAQLLSGVKSRFFTPEGLNWVVCPAEREEALHLLLAAVRDVRQEDTKEPEKATDDSAAAGEKSDPTERQEQEDTESIIPQESDAPSLEQDNEEAPEEEER